MRKFLFTLGIALLAVFAGPAQAQLRITHNSACNADGVGYVLGHDGRGVLTPRTAAQAAAAAKLGTYVAADGWWTVCPEPAAVAAKPADCNIPAPLRWTANGLLCQAHGGGLVQHGKLSQAIQAQAGPVTGVNVMACHNGQLSTRIATCDLTQYCFGGYRASEDGEATWWSWDGTLRNGERGTATHESGRTRLIECSGGKLRML